MSKVYFTSDWHLGHRNILKYRPEFPSIEAHDSTLIDNFNSIITKRDVVYFLGDIIFTDEALELFKSLNHCRKILVMGNHDYLDVSEYRTVFDDVVGLKSYRGFWLSHCPIHPQEMRNRIGNIHGHLHHSILQDPAHMYFDVSPEKHNYYPVGLEHIAEHFASYGRVSSHKESL